MKCHKNANTQTFDFFSKHTNATSFLNTGGNYKLKIILKISQTETNQDGKRASNIPIIRNI